MAFHFSPKIANTGLIYNFDAINRSSYAGSGLVYSDITRYGVTGSLTATTTFSTNVGGELNFHGNDHASVIIDANNAHLTTTIWTVEAWFKSNPTQIDTFPGIFNKDGEFSGNGNFGNYGIYTNSAGTYIRMGFFPTDNSGIVEVSNTNYSDVKTDTWFCYGGTFDGTNLILYRNGELIAQTTTEKIPSAGNNNRLKFGGRGQSTGFSLSGSVAIGRVYNRALTSAEMLQNYNALKRRFGL